MDARFRILTGGSAGAEVLLGDQPRTLGRHPRSDVRFDPETDLAVSALHAVVTKEGGDWYVQDLGSTNGTFVRGERISVATRLLAGDQIQLGAEGPILEFHTGSPAPSATPVSPPTRQTVAGGTPPMPRESPTGERIRVAVAAQTRRLKVLSSLCAMLLIVAVSLLLFSGRRDRADWDRERAEMRERIDSLLIAGATAARSLEGQLSTLGAALQESQELVRRTRDELAHARRRGDSVQVQQLERELSDATTTLSRQSSAAQLDFGSIQRLNRRAIALVYVESATGEISTGTAFAVRSDAMLLTNRHVVVGRDVATPPRRIAVQFSDSDQIWPARLLAASRAEDLAVIKVDNIEGSVPVVRGFNQQADTIRVGAPVALIGYPNGGEGGVSSGSGRTVARPNLATGVLERITRSRLEIEGYGAAGASGSPVFDANGEVIGVLFGGSNADDRHVVFAVPASAAIRLLGTMR